MATSLYIFCLLFAMFSIGRTSPSLGVAKSTTFSIKVPTQVHHVSMHNIHLDYDGELHDEVEIYYGDCARADYKSSHHMIAHTTINRTSQPDRLIWIVPDETPSGGCVTAISSLKNKIIARSAPIEVLGVKTKRQSLADVADPEGAWFNGVAYLHSKNTSTVSIAAAKDKSKSLVPATSTH